MSDNNEPKPDRFDEFVAAVLQHPRLGVKVARISLEARAHDLRWMVQASEARAAGAEGPIPEACRLLAHTYREALKPINRALLALATEGAESEPS